MKRYLLLFLVIILSSCSNDIEPNSYYGNTLKDFEAINQDGQSFTRDNMENKVWLVNQIFTNCVTVCPPMTANLAELTLELKDNNLTDVGLVSFSVDPEYDSPEILSEYISWYDKDESIEWQLLTGYDFEYIRDYALNNFKSVIKAPQDGGNQVLHSTALYLVDEDGVLIKDYSGVDVGEQEFNSDEIIKDLKKLN
ncbi:SCO family protein [Jeotgalicoccus sp. S0W5]|uniref:SCO family protein n=1 Tax=Jeotgalicoccus sp. S0W5 TaxID=2527874 RepID=UPI00141504E0|nr:SCO family protein [Jeotgalicoccus sp. S0W5]